MSEVKLYLGCAVWSYKGWLGNFYPKKTQPKDFLNLYAQQLNTVEGNSTFYAVPQPQTIAKWSTQVNLDFRFCPKFPKDVTHKGLLFPKLGAAEVFLKIVSGLGNNLGLTFIQLPPSYSPKYFADLENFLVGLKSPRIALEVRHPEWFTPPYAKQLNQLLAELDITRVLLDKS